MSVSNSSFFNGSVLPTNWNWGGSSDPNVMGGTDTFAPGSGPGNLPILPTGYGGSPAPGSTAGGIAGFGTGLGMNIGTGQLALGGLSALGNLWSAFQANSLGKKSLDAQTTFANANLKNQIQSYNTSLTDRATARGATENQTPAQVQQYIATNSLSR